MSQAQYPHIVQAQGSLVVSTGGSETIHFSGKSLQFQPFLQPPLSLLPCSHQLQALLVQEPQSTGHLLGVWRVQDCHGLALSLQMLQPVRDNQQRPITADSSCQPSSSLASTVRSW
jgi:hypothetical protein